MAIHVVMEPPATAGKSASESAVFIRDGFHFFGFVAPLLWLVWHRLWLEAALIFAASLAFAAASEWAGLGLSAAVLPLLVSLYVALEGGALRIAAFSRAGWRHWGVIEADSADDAETRYMFAAEPAADVSAPATVAVSSATPRPHASGAALGLLHYPGRH